MANKKELLEKLRGFQGGQIEIQNSFEDSQRRGGIATIAVTNKVIRVNLAWGTRRLNGESQPDADLMFIAPLSIFKIESEKGNLRLVSSVTGQTAILIPSSKPCA